MQNHHGRFLLVSCLTAAVTAQAPTLDNSKFREVGSGATNAPDKSVPQEASGRTLGDYTPRYASDFQEQNPEKYTLRSLFMQAHGDFMNRRERYDAPIELRAKVMPNQRVNHEPGTFDMLGYDFDADVPVLVAPDGFLKFGAYYQGRSYQFSNAFGSQGNAPGSMPDETLHAAGIKLGFGIFLDDNWLFEMESAPGIWSDADGGLHHEDYDFPSYALFTVRTMDAFFLKFGLRYNQIYEEAPWLPYLGFSWEITEGFRFDVLAPEKLEFSFWPSSSTGFLAGCEVTGAEYEVRTSLATGSLHDSLQVQEVIAYLGLVHRFSDSFSLRGRGGLVVAGDYDLTNGNPAFNNVEGALDQGFYADLSIGFDF
jgi:hypothetical protein